MAFFYPSQYTPSSYANSLYGSPYVLRRRPSPPPRTYYSPRTVDPYIQALAEEQAARTALQEAIERENEARKHRAAEEARVRALAEQEALARARAARQRPQTIYGYPYIFTQPDYDSDEDVEEEVCSPYDIFGYAPRRPTRRVPQTKPVPRMTRSESRNRPLNVFEQPTCASMQPEQTRQQTPPAPETIRIHISSPGPSIPEQVLHEAASKIQQAYRSYSARKAAFADIDAIKQSFESLRTSFTFPTSLEFQSDPASPDAAATPEDRPALAYTSENAPVHGYEDGLVKLLQKLDAIESHGDVAVRDARRAMVKAIEEELGSVDANIRRVWEERVTAAQAAPKQRSGDVVESMDTDEVVPETQAQDEPMATADDVPVSEANTEDLTPSVADPAPEIVISDEPQVTIPAETMEIEPAESSPDPVVPESKTESDTDMRATPSADVAPSPASADVNIALDVLVSPALTSHEDPIPTQPSGSAVTLDDLSPTHTPTLVAESDSIIEEPTNPDSTVEDSSIAPEPIIEEPESDTESIPHSESDSDTDNEEATPPTPSSPTPPSLKSAPPSPTFGSHRHHHVTVEDAPENDDDEGEMVTVEEVLESPLKTTQSEHSNIQQHDSDFVMI